MRDAAGGLAASARTGKPPCGGSAHPPSRTRPRRGFATPRRTRTRASSSWAPAPTATWRTSTTRLRCVRAHALPRLGLHARGAPRVGAAPTPVRLPCPAPFSSHAPERVRPGKRGRGARPRHAGPQPQPGARGHAGMHARWQPAPACFPVHSRPRLCTAPAGPPGAGAGRRRQQAHHRGAHPRRPHRRLGADEQRARGRGADRLVPGSGRDGDPGCAAGHHAALGCAPGCRCGVRSSRAVWAEASVCVLCARARVPLIPADIARVNVGGTAAGRLPNTWYRDSYTRLDMTNMNMAAALPEYPGEPSHGSAPVLRLYGPAWQAGCSLALHARPPSQARPSMFSPRQAARTVTGGARRRSSPLATDYRTPAGPSARPRWRRRAARAPPPR